MTTSIIFSEKSPLSLDSFEFVQDSKEKLSELGTGSFAKVRLAKEKKTGKYFALKMISLNPAKLSKADLYYIKTEVQIHRQLDHPNVIKFHGHIQEASNLYLVLDYAENGNLYNYIQNKKILTPNEIFHFFYQACLAVQYIHQSDVLHRDIKPENILIDKDLNIKLCDFGWSARSVREKRTTLCGTYEYMAPEIVWKKAYDYRIDIWSLGILLYELIHSEAPYKGRNLAEITESFKKSTIKFSTIIQPEAKDLIEKILRIEPNERISLTDILSHTWVKYHLTKREYLQNMTHSVSSRTHKPDSSLSPRFKQAFYVNKTIKEHESYFVVQEKEVQPSQEQEKDFSLTVQVPSVIGVPRVFERIQQESLEQIEPINDKGSSEDKYDLTLIAQMNIGRSNKENGYASATLPKKLAEKWAFKARKLSNDTGGKKVFEKNIMSPDFNTKLNSILQQLNVKPLPMSEILSPQSRNFENNSKQNQLNPTFFGKNENIRTKRSNRQAPSKENTHNMTCDFSTEKFKVNYNPISSTKATSRSRGNYSNLRLDINNSRIEPTAHPNVPTLKVNFTGKVKPETVKASFQRYFGFEAGFSSQKTTEFSLDKTILNNIYETNSTSFSRKIKLEGKLVTNGYSSPYSPGFDLQKKISYNSSELTTSYKILHGAQSVKNRDNKIDISREIRNQYIKDKLLTQR